ncbi:MAG: hypothetical protein ACTSXH_06355 [Promethearchaeota archaeon]
MRLFKLGDKKELIEINKIPFDSGEIYVVDDDDDIVNIWIGSKSTSEKRDFAKKYKEKLEQERGKEIRILIMEENQEYGTFLAIMDDLKGDNAVIRISQKLKEFKLKKPETIKWMEEIEKYREWSSYKKEEIQKRAEEQFSQFGEMNDELTENLKTKISIVAYYIAQEKYEYSELCWMLAERIVRQQPMASIENIRLKSDEIFKSSTSYDELCWLIAQMDVLGKAKYIKDTKISFI